MIPPKIASDGIPPPLCGVTLSDCKVGVIVNPFPVIAAAFVADGTGLVGAGDGIVVLVAMGVRVGISGVLEGGTITGTVVADSPSVGRAVSVSVEVADGV